MAIAVPLYRIPLLPGRPQALAVTLGDIEYRLRLTWNDAPEGGWLMDIGDAQGQPLICGIALFPQQDLLGQYAHLNIGGGGSMFVHGAGVTEEAPTLTGLGSVWQLYFVPPTRARGPFDGLSLIPAGFEADIAQAQDLGARFDP